MDYDEILMDTEERMEKALEVVKRDLAGIRTGRANPGLVDSLKIDVYGSPTPIKQVASVSAPEPTQIVIRPYDPSTIKDIEKGIIAANLGLNPQSDGRVVRVNVPPLSTDVRKKMVGRVKEIAEGAKVAIRNIRRDANKHADQSQKDKTLSEDERDDAKKEVQDLTKKFEDKVSTAAKARETEVMED